MQSDRSVGGSLLRSALQRFGLEPGHSPAGLESRSGAGVHAVRTSSGDAAYLKLAPVALGSEALTAARRELRFYSELAARVPVRTPRLLKAADDDEGIALLLAATGAPVPAGAWTPGMWAALGRDLAALHETDMGEVGWARLDTLRSALATPDLVAVDRFWGATLPRLADLIAGREELANAMDALPSAFVHGDCHTGNIAVAGESLIFLDWQMSGTGRPGTDLSSLNVRAAPAGMTAPPELTAAYLSNRDVDQRTLERALLAGEMAVYVFQWPPFAAYNTPAGVERVRQRVSLLATRWFQEAYA